MATNLGFFFVVVVVLAGTRFLFLLFSTLVWSVLFIFQGENEFIASLLVKVGRVIEETQRE